MEYGLEGHKARRRPAVQLACLFRGLSHWFRLRYASGPGHQFSVDEGHVWLGWGIRSGGRIWLIRSQQNSSNVGDGICDFRVHSSSFYLDHRLGQQSSHIGSRLRWGRGFLWLLEGVVTPQTYAAPQLDSFIGVRMEIAEAAFRSPSRTSRAVFLCALAPLSWGYRWLKLYLRRIPSHAVS